MLESTFALPVWEPLKARVLIATGARDRANQSIAKLTARGLAALERDTNWLISAALLAETVSQAANPRFATELARVLEPRADHWAVSARGTVCLGPIAGSLALLAATAGDLDEAERYFQRAREQCLAAGAGPVASRLESQYRAFAADPAATR